MLYFTVTDERKFYKMGASCYNDYIDNIDESRLIDFLAENNADAWAYYGQARAYDVMLKAYGWNLSDRYNNVKELKERAEKKHFVYLAFNAFLKGYLYERCGIRKVDISHF